MGRKINKKVKISEVYFDEDLYPRTSYYWQTAYDYQQSMLSGAKFPPIVLALYNKKLYLVDGKHRLEAHKLLKLDFIDAEVHLGWNKKRIFEEAIRLNISHGKVLSVYEKRCIVLRLKTLRYSDKDISDLVQVPMERLEKFIAERMVSALGQPQIVKEKLKHLSGHEVNEEAMDSQKSFSGGSQKELINELIILLKNNLINKEDEEIISLLKLLKKLL